MIGPVSAEAVDDPDEDQVTNAQQVNDHLLGAATPVLCIMGNDDSVELEPIGESLVPLHARRVKHGLYNFVGYQFFLPWMGGVFERPEEEIATDLASLEGLLDSRTVFVTVSHQDVEHAR